MKTIHIEQKENYQILKLQRGRANPINFQMISEIRTAIKNATTDDSIRGVILTGHEHFFTAGLDVIELYHNDEAQMLAFWQNFSAMTYELAAFPKPLIAAITGHSPAGGTVLAICCDYRVMAEGKYHIGLNEIPVGIVASSNIFHLYSFWLGTGKAYACLMEGRLMSPKDALNIGLVQEVLPFEEVLAKAEEKMKQFLSFPQGTWIKTKRNARRTLLAHFNEDKEEQFSESLAQWWTPESRATMGAIVKRLTKK